MSRTNAEATRAPLPRRLRLSRGRCKSMRSRYSAPGEGVLAGRRPSSRRDERACGRPSPRPTKDPDRTMTSRREGPPASPPLRFEPVPAPSFTVLMPVPSPEAFPPATSEEFGSDPGPTASRSRTPPPTTEPGPTLAVTRLGSGVMANWPRASPGGISNGAASSAGVGLKLKRLVKARARTFGMGSGPGGLGGVCLAGSTEGSGGVGAE